MLQLIPAAEGDRALLFNLNQKYLYEMTAFYDDPMDEAGNFHYGHFDEYFTDPRRRALLIRWDGRLAGFAMLHPYSNFDESPDHVMAEFTVFPHFRRNHLALEAARRILEAWPGRWEIKYNELNAPAKALWNRIAAPYSPEKRAYSEVETVLMFTVPAAAAENHEPDHIEA